MIFVYFCTSAWIFEQYGDNNEVMINFLSDEWGERKEVTKDKFDYLRCTLPTNIGG